MDNTGKLITLIAAGDKEALKSLMTLCGGGIKSVAYRVLKDEALCDDVLCSVIYKIWENAARLKGIKNIKGYLYVMAYNAAIDIKRKQRDVFFDDGNINAVPPPGGSDDYEKLYINEILQKLDGRLRDVLLLKADCGYSFSEIARIKNISYKKVRNLYTKACEEFKNLYKKA